MATNSLGYRIDKNPIAQSFFVDTVAGIYITKIDLYFASKDNSFPVSLQLRPMENGFPSSTEIIPGSEVVVPGSNINVSVNATAATSFSFEEPIYLKGLTDYAIVVNADSTDYDIYISQINEFLIGSTEKRVDRQPSLGSLFFSQNNTTWTPSQDQDLTFKIYKAKFTQTDGEVVLHNASVPKRLLDVDPFTVVSGDATITVNHPNHGLQIGEDIKVLNSTAVGGINASSINGTRTITAVDWTGYQFEADSTADSDVIGGGSSVLATKNIPYTAIYPHLQTLLPVDTALASQFKGTTGKSFAGGETAFQKDVDYNIININATSYGEFPYIVVNDSSETTELGSNIKSMDLNLFMRTFDNNVTPMIDMQRASATLINTIIDKPAESPTSGFNTQLNYVAETDPSLGSSAAKHIMEPVTLDQDAVGLKIILSANRPPETDFLVYYRIASGDEIIKNKNWILQPEDTNNPPDAVESVYREYRYLPGGLSGNLNAFTQFQVKIIMRSTNAAKVPVIKDLRIIALSV